MLQTKKAPPGPVNNRERVGSDLRGVPLRSSALKEYCTEYL